MTKNVIEPELREREIRDLTVEEIDCVTGGAGFDAICTHDNAYAEWIWKYYKVCV
jgi:hypothetical protein